jgi:hypothetical protein
MYDGASAAAEAVLMARRLVGREHTVISGGIHPEYLETIETHVRGLGTGKASLTTVPVAADGAADVDALTAAITPETACVVVGYPNFYGSICDLRKVAEAAHAKGALVITATQDPFALALLESPGALGADIAVGEDSRSASRRSSAAPAWGSSRAATTASTSSRSPAAWSARPSTRRATAATCSRWPRASNTSAASGPRATSARTAASARPR